MKVKELIKALLECDMNYEVELKTINTDKYGYPHSYKITSIDFAPIYDSASGDVSIRLLFKNYDFERKNVEDEIGN